MARPKNSKKTETNPPADKREEEKYYITGKTVATIILIAGTMGTAMLFMFNASFDSKARNLEADYKIKLGEQEEKYRRSMFDCIETTSALRDENRKIKFLREQDSIKKSNHE